MEEWIFDDFSDLVNLLFSSTNIFVGDIRFLLHSHHCHCRINLWWQRNLNLILGSVHSDITLAHTRHGNCWMNRDVEISSVICGGIVVDGCDYYGKDRKHSSVTHPTLIPSSMSVGATLFPSPTTNLAICFTLMIYFASSVPASMIFVHLAT